SSAASGKISIRIGLSGFCSLHSSATDWCTPPGCASEPPSAHTISPPPSPSAASSPPPGVHATASSANPPANVAHVLSFLRVFISSSPAAHDGRRHVSISPECRRNAPDHAALSAQRQACFDVEEVHVVGAETDVDMVTNLRSVLRFHLRYELLTTLAGPAFHLGERFLIVDRLAHVLGNYRRCAGTEVDEHLGAEQFDHGD